MIRGILIIVWVCLCGLKTLSQPATRPLHNGDDAYPLLVPYDEEQGALTFLKENSPWCIDVASGLLYKKYKHSPVALRDKTTPQVNTGEAYMSFKTPDRWVGKIKFLHFAAQNENIKLFINGAEAAYIQKGTPFRLNITSLLLEQGENLIELKCDLPIANKSNLLKNIQIIATPTVHIVNVDIGKFDSPMPQSTFNWFQGVELKNYDAIPYQHQNRYLFTYYDHLSLSSVRSQEIKYESEYPLKQGDVQHAGTGYSLGNFKIWTSETPDFYFYTIEVRNQAKEKLEVVSGRVGFRNVNILDGRLGITGYKGRQPITLKPVLYQRPVASNGVESKSAITEEILRLKEHNVNTIIVSEAPADSMLYDACDRLGVYVIQKMDLVTATAKANQTQTEKNELAAREGEQVVPLVGRLKEHPSIIAWVLNAKYSGSPHYRLLAQQIHDKDPDRLIGFTDLSLLNTRIIHKPIPVEWYKIPDWNKLSPSGRNDLKRQYQYVDFSIKSQGVKKLVLKNNFDFTTLDHTSLKWQILNENKVVQEGEMNVVKGLPGKNLEVNLPFAFENYIDGNYAFRFGLVLKESTVWAGKGYEIAWEEFAFKSTDQGRYLVKKEGF